MEPASTAIQNEENFDFLRQVYLLLAAFLNSQGHQQLTSMLLKTLEERKLVPTSYNWKGNLVMAEEASSNNNSTGLELLLQHCLNTRENQLISNLTNDLVSMAAKLQGRLGRVSFATFCKLAEERSVLNQTLQGFYSSAMPWSFPPDLWADTLLTVAANRFIHLKTVTGHRLPAYCVLFDRCDRRLITGGDDGIVKVWCVQTFILLHSFRSHSNCISDMSIDVSNQYLAVGSIDGYISLWNLAMGKHLFTINAFSPILTLEFGPVEGPTQEVVLMATCSDGYAKFWVVNLQLRTASASPIKFHCKSLARDEIRCASFSPAGTRFVTGATDGIVRLIKVPKVDEIKSNAHPSLLLPNIHYLEDHEGYVNSVHYSGEGTRFVTSSWDGCVREWRCKAQIDECRWISTAYETAIVLGGSQDAIVPGRPRKVTIVSYCCGDNSIVAAVNQTFELVLFSVDKIKPARRFSYHEGEVYILTTNPADDRIVLSGGCDGKAALWNMESGKKIFEFHLPNTRFLDGGFSQNGQMFALTDDMGRTSIFGSGISADAYEKIPESQFFPTDWNELVFDAQRNAIDAVTQRSADIAPRNIIVSIEKEEYPPIINPSYADSISIEVDEVILEKQRELFLRQYRNEKLVFDNEVRFTPPGSMPKHARSRRKRLLYGSDVEDIAPLPNGTALTQLLESDDEPFQLRNGDNSETEAELGVTTSTEADEADNDQEEAMTGPYNLRRRLPEASPRPIRITPRRAPVPELLDDDELYRPSYARVSNSSPRRRPVIRDSSSSTTDSVSVKMASDWVAAKERRLFPYHPQIYDVVAYFPAGHRMFLEKESRPEFTRDLPWSQLDDHSEDVIVGQIISLHFIPGDPTFCQLQMIILARDEVGEKLPPATNTSHHQKITITFYDMDGQPDFIIPYCRYEWSVAPQNRFKPNEIVRVVFSGNEVYEAKVKKLNVPAYRIPQRPWQCYLVEWLSLDDPPESLSPWELETILEEDAPQRQAYKCQEFIETDVIAVLKEGLDQIFRDTTALLFKKPVDLFVYADYLETVAYPMDLTLLCDRLTRNYYRRIEAFEWDARLIYQNAFAYNLPDSDIVADAEGVVDKLVRLVKRAERGTRRLYRSDPPSRGSSSIPNSPPAPTHNQLFRNRAISEREQRARRRATLDLRQSSPPDHIAMAAARQLGNRNVPFSSATLALSGTSRINSSFQQTRKRTRQQTNIDTFDDDHDDDGNDNDNDGGAIIFETERESSDKESDSLIFMTTRRAGLRSTRDYQSPSSVASTSRPNLRRHAARFS